MLITYTTNAFPFQDIQTAANEHMVTVQVDEREVNLVLGDVVSPENYPRLRVLSYPGIDVFVVCFSLVSPTSLQNVESQWVPEIRHHAPDVPFVLVGTKQDLRDDQNTLRGVEMVSTEAGKKAAKSLGADAYVECSSLTQHGLHATFDTAIRCALTVRTHPKPRKGGCVIM